MKKIMTIVVVAVMLQLAVVSMASAAPPASGPDGHRYTPNYGYNYNNTYNRYHPVVRYPAYRPVYSYYNNGYCCYCYPTYQRAYYGQNYYNRYYW